MQTDHGIHIATTIQVQVHPNGVVRAAAVSRSYALPTPSLLGSTKLAPTPRLRRSTEQ